MAGNWVRTPGARDERAEFDSSTFLSIARVAQQAEAACLNQAQCPFESDRVHLEDEAGRSPTTAC